MKHPILKKIKNQANKGVFLFGLLLLITPQFAFAHCDSYDGPVIKDALKALKQNNITLVLKWVDEEHEKEIKQLFQKTQTLQNTDPEIYTIIEKHFLETLVRLHREGEGAPYTGLKPAGSTTQIVQMADNALAKNDINTLSKDFTAHIEKVVKEKYEKAQALSKTKDDSVEKGRAYVEAYVDYTHTLEGIHEILEHGGGHSH